MIDQPAEEITLSDEDEQILDRAWARLDQERVNNQAALVLAMLNRAAAGHEDATGHLDANTQADLDTLANSTGIVQRFAESANPARQQSPWSCGPAALRAALQRLGLPDPGEPALVQLCGTTEAEGTPPDRLTKACVTVGLSARSLYLIRPQQLPELLADGVLLCPVQMWGGQRDMASDRAGHWACVTGSDGRTVTLVDPADDGPERRLGLAEFCSRWHDRAVDGTPYRRFGIVVGRG